MNVGEVLRAARDVAFWRALAPSLRVGDLRLEAWPARGERLGASGFARIERVVPPERVAALAGALQSLHHANIPTPALYVYDDAWEIAAGLAPTFAALLGAPPRLLPDVWAWLVPSEAGASGWSPHRGVTQRDTRIVNAWVSLSDVSEASACMHVVPLDRDPFHPDALERIDVDPSLAVPLPVPPGSLLAWNANVLHWGGAMKPGAPPRLSMSFSLAPEGARAPDAPPPFEARVDLLAEMLVTYETIGGVSGVWLEWARLWSGMRAAKRT